MERYTLGRWEKISDVGSQGQTNTNVVSIRIKDTKERGAQVNLPNLASIRNHANRNIHTKKRIYGSLVMSMVPLISGRKHVYMMILLSCCSINPELHLL